MQKGDIIYINEFLNEDGQKVGGHPFIVLSVGDGNIKALEFDLVTTMISSLSGKSEEHKNKKLSYKYNIPVDVSDGVIKESFIKSDQVFYFSSIKTTYHIVGTLREELIEMIMQNIEQALDEGKLVVNTHNLID